MDPTTDDIANADKLIKEIDNDLLYRLLIFNEPINNANLSIIDDNIIYTPISNQQNHKK